MGPSLKKLLSIASSALCAEVPKVPSQLLVNAGVLGDQLVELLHERNGFYAFEAALHFFPSGCRSAQIDIEIWNRDDGWRSRYDNATDGYLFFAEEAFGEQFALRNGRVHRFDPETAQVEQVAIDLEEWATRVLENYEYETGYPLAYEWQERYGPLAMGQRLLPKIPFVLGGAYEVENLYALDAVKGMEFRADIWRQIRDLPKGTKVKLKIVE